MLSADTGRVHAQGAESDGPRMHRAAALHFHNEANPCDVRVYAGADVTCATVQPVVSSLTFTDKRGLLLRAFSVAFAGSGRPQGVFA